DAARLVAGAALLAAASVQDWRTRRIDDRYWVALGSLGLALFAAESVLEGARWEHYLIFVPAAILFYATFFGEELLTEEGFRFRPVRIALFTAALLALLLEGFLLLPTADAGIFLQDLTIPVMIAVALLFYLTGLLHGGADVKALMAITLLVPRYPGIDGFPLLESALDPRLVGVLSIAYPFSLVALTNAALAFVVAPLGMLVHNARRGSVRFPHALVGYRVPVDRVPRFAWVMERIEGGRRVTVFFPRRGWDREEALRSLREAGAQDVWVMPQIPFLIPMTAGFLVAFLLGNVLFGVVALGLGR
ncbi:MAG TPA: A24 family peptidase C-terminal domain-containing protein, partial [Thermoplasmata archaeon]|nr:A24 family peptidase C-terminal domain-containing protein [Thermoplasmata archaeon]